MAADHTRSVLPLPLEIRNEIYALLLSTTIDRNMGCSHGVIHGLRTRKHIHHTSAMARVSHQTREELLMVYYAKEHLSFHTADELYFCLDGMALSRRQCVQHVSVCCRGSKSTAAFELLKDCTRLKTCNLYFHFGVLPARESLYQISGVTKVKIEILPSRDAPYVADEESVGPQFCGSGARCFRDELDTIQEAMMRPHGESGKLVAP